MKEKLFTLFKIIFVFLVSLIIIGPFFYQVNVYYNVNHWLTLACALGVTSIWYTIYFFISKAKKISLKKELIFLTIYFILILISMYVIVKYLKVAPGWDVGVIFTNAQDFVEGRPYTHPNYLQQFPNNTLLFFVLAAAIKIGGILHISALNSCIIANSFFIFTAIALLYLCVRKYFNVKKAIFAAIMVFFFTPLLLYNPIFYTDTMSLMFPLLLLYLYSFVDCETPTKKNLLFILMAIVAFIGIQMKMTIIIILFAIIIDIFLKNKFLYFIKALGIILITLTILLMGYTKVIIENPIFKFKYDEYGSIPYSHWIMMGLEDKENHKGNRNSFGGYNLDDYNKTLSFTTGKESITYHKTEIIKRLKYYGVVGYSDYLMKKLVNAFGDGTYFSSLKLNINPTTEMNFLRNTVVSSGSNFKTYLYFSQGVQFAMLFILLIGTIIDIKKKDNRLTFIALAVFGLAMFLLLWENRSRYVVTFIPLFIILITNYMPKLCSYFKKENINEK